MSRTKGSSGVKTKAAIRAAGRALIYKHGYEGMNLRELADAVGLQQGSLYNHFRSKQQMLFDLMKEHLVAIIEELKNVLAREADPLKQMKAFVAFHLTYHMQRQDEVYINNSELRSLEPANLRKINALRYEYERLAIGIVEAGVKAGKFKVSEPKVATFALIALLTGICNWYKPGGRLSKAALVDIHTDMALRSLVGR